MPGFDKIDGVHRNFIEALARGQIQMSLLLSKEAASTKQHITMETSHATNALATHVSLEACKVSTDISVRLDRNAEEQLQQRVLRSLKYEKMNARRNMVADAYDRTFEWIFNTAARVSYIPSPTNLLKLY
jgi:hypothetical protein